MKGLLIIAFLNLFAAAPFADMTIQKDMAGDCEAIGGATGICTIQYYNHCSGWIWTMIGNRGDQVGTIYDLPNDCGKLAGEVCQHIETAFFCYDNIHGRGFTFTVEMYDVDAQGCLLSGHGPITVDPRFFGWNYTGPLGTTSSDFVAITYTWDSWHLPRIGVGPAKVLNPLPGYDCTGLVSPPTFYQWVYNGTPYCPPYLFYKDGININMREISWFDCQEGTASEDASWGGVKNLFR